MRGRKRFLSLLLAFLLVLQGTAALALSYTGSASYAAGRYYTALQNVTLTGDRREDIVAVALSQVGYQEGGNSSQLSGEIKGDANYTEYGRWYGLQDMWCAMFVSWCADTAGIPASVVPKHSFTVSGLNTFIGRDRAYTRAAVAAGDYMPQKGDIIYFKSARNTNKTNHVGIVTGYADRTVSTVEGNTSSETISTNGGAVCTKSYSIDNTYIVYICSPAYTDEPVVTLPALVGYFPACAPGYTSLADALRSVGADGSYAARKRIAAANGIEDYSGTAAQNTALLDLLKAGRLIDPDAEPVDNGCFPACDASYTMLAAALESIGADASFAYRAQIAAANGIDNYSGTVDQNTAMLSLLIAGALRRPDAVSTPTVTYFTACDSSYSSLVDALRSIGADSSRAYRGRIAAANGIDNYSGTAAQNTTLLNLLKAGQLIVPTDDTTQKSPCGCDAQFAEHILLPPSCAEDGAEYDRCTACGAIFNRTTLPAAGHSFTLTHTDPTCAEDGADEYVCSCGEHYTVPVPASGHTFDETDYSRVTTAHGVRTVQCAHCNATTDVLAGDIDGDGARTLKDAILLQRSLAGWEIEVSVPRADVNRDRKADLVDAALLLRYMVGGWNVELL